MNRRLIAALVLALVVCALAVQSAGCGGTASDPFVGSWWEPTSGQRVLVKAAGDGYEVLVGTDLKALPATVSGGELHVAHPDLGALVLKTAPDDKLQLVSGGTESLLERAPQHQ